MQPSVESTPRTTSPTLLPAFTGCAPRNGSITRSLCWRTKFYTELRRGIWDHSFLLPISPAGGHYALVAPIVWWCHLSDVQQSVAGPRVCNTLPEEITTSQTFRQRLTWLFRKSYPDIIIWTFLIQTINLEVAMLHRQFLIDWLIEIHFYVTLWSRCRCISIGADTRHRSQLPATSIVARMASRPSRTSRISVWWLFIPGTSAAAAATAAEQRVRSCGQVCWYDRHT